MMSTVFQQIGPQAVELWADVPAKLAGEAGGVTVQQPREIGERRIARGQVIQ